MLFCFLIHIIYLLHLFYIKCVFCVFSLHHSHNATFFLNLQVAFRTKNIGFTGILCYNSPMKSYIDEKLFEEAKNRMYGKVQGEKGIGTLSEKSVHSVLKYYFAPNEIYHEHKIGTFVADVCIDGEIYEIQTKQFYLMKRKLDYFLKEHEVTIVYPVSLVNTLHWVECDENCTTNERADTAMNQIKDRRITISRKTRKKGIPYLFFHELYGIKDFLHHPNLHFILAIMSTEEYRLLDGYGPQKKIRATKTDKVPIELLDLITIHKPEDYKQLIPEGLPDEFTSDIFARKAGIGRSLAGTALNVLYEMDVVKRVGKQGNAYVYRINES